MSDPFNNSTYYLYRLIKYVFHHSGKNWQQQQPRQKQQQQHLLNFVFLSSFNFNAKPNFFVLKTQQWLFPE